MNFSEREFEDWFFEHGNVGVFSEVEWLYRQVSLPSGIADVVGVLHGDIVLVELKAEGFKSRHLCQVKRYQRDLLDAFDHDVEVFCFVIATGQPDQRLIMEAAATGVSLKSVKPSFSLSGTWFLTEDMIDSNADRLESSAVIAELKETIFETLSQQEVERVRRRELASRGNAQSFYQEIADRFYEVRNV